MLDRLLEEPWLEIDGVSGTSAGAMNAAGSGRRPCGGRPDGARAALERFWRSVSDAARFSPFQRTPLDQLSGRWTLDNSPLYVVTVLVARMVSPYDLNPGGTHPLSAVLAKNVDFGRLTQAR